MTGRAGQAPERQLPDDNSPHFRLYRDVREAIASLPIHFRTETQISGILATDLYTLNAALGATIEEQVVRTLNITRNVWDPNGEFALYRFVRQAQTFPDVLLRRASDGDVLLGIELKGWYLLAKEAEPSLRFQVTVEACAIQDLIVVVPWTLGNVISGSPILFEPFVESARYAAAYRNHHWQSVRKTQLSTDIKVPDHVSPYPSKSDQILDRPVGDNDRGGNFGRLARTGLMDSYIAKVNDVNLCGIKAIYWREFLRIFQEGVTEAKAQTALVRLKERVDASEFKSSTTARSALRILEEFERLLMAD